MGGPEGFATHQFPRVDLTIPVDGKKLEYSFTVSVYSYGGSKAEDFRFASASFQAAVYREGEITLDGKKHQIVLLDANGNGRFDDEARIPGNVHFSGGGIYVETGDVLLVDPRSARPTESIGEIYGGEHRRYLSKLAMIDDKYYEVKISPAGDQLTLTPSTLKPGFLTNPSGSFTGMIYGDHGFLPIRGKAGKPAAVPEGQWKLLSCEIEVKGWKPPPKPPKEPEKKDGEKKDGEKKESEPKDGEKKASSTGLLESITRALLGSPSAEPQYGPRGISSVSANGTDKCPAVTVRPGETATLPFGPPYKPVVEAVVVPAGAAGGMGGVIARLAPASGDREAELSMSLVGSGGESVSNLVVDGYRPKKPDFTITNPKDEVVQKGSFEYG